MTASNTTVIYRGILTLEIKGILTTLAVNYHSARALEKVGFLLREFIMVNYRGIFVTLTPGDVEAGTKSLIITSTQ
jgi:hypothetical protein